MTPTPLGRLFGARKPDARIRHEEHLPVAAIAAADDARRMLRLYARATRRSAARRRRRDGAALGAAAGGTRGRGAGRRRARRGDRRDRRRPTRPVNPPPPPPGYLSAAAAAPPVSRIVYDPYGQRFLPRILSLLSSRPTLTRRLAPRQTTASAREGDARTRSSCTTPALQNGAAALALLCDPVTQVSAHYVVMPDGARTPARAGRCAGPGMPASASGPARRDMNDVSIGIEIAHRPPRTAGRLSLSRHPDRRRHRARPDIAARWDIAPDRVLAHSDIAPRRKSIRARYSPGRSRQGGRRPRRHALPDRRRPSGSSPARESRGRRAAGEPGALRLRRRDQRRGYDARTQAVFAPSSVTSVRRSSTVWRTPRRLRPP